MGIGAISGMGAMPVYGFGSNYKVHSVNGNPRSLQPVEKIGEEQYNSKPFAVVSKENNESQSMAAQESKPAEFNFDAAMSRMMIGSRYNAENIPVVDLAQA